MSAYPFAMESDHPIGVNYKILNGAKANKYVKDNGGITDKAM